MSVLDRTSFYAPLGLQVPLSDKLSLQRHLDNRLRPAYHSAFQPFAVKRSSGGTLLPTALVCWPTSVWLRALFSLSMPQ